MSRTTTRAAPLLLLGCFAACAVGSRESRSGVSSRAGVGAGRGAGSEAGAFAGRPPNVILIMADDLGYGEVGCYGQKKIATPRLDRMAAEGMRFTQWYAPSPVCAPTRASLMTGLHSGRAIIRDNREVRPEGQAPLPAASATLPAAMKSAGYDTAMIGKWGLGAPGSEGEPGRQGFDDFFGYLCQREAHHFFPTHLWRLTKDAVSRDAVRVDLPGNTKVEGDAHAEDLFRDELRAYLRSRGDRPFFLYVPFTLPHLALQPPEEDLAAWRGRFPETPYDGKNSYLPHPTPRAAYAAMISRLDADIGVVLDELQASGRDQDTIVFATSDNGPTHDVGGVDTKFFDSTRGLRGRRGSLFEGGIRVPMIVRAPGRVAPGTVSEHVGAHQDLFVTATTIARAGAPPTDGVDAAPVLFGSSPRIDRPLLYWEFSGYGGWQAVRAGDLKLVRRELHQGPIVEELFDLSTDPNEATDLASKRLDDVARLRALAAAARTPSAAFPFPALDGAGD